MKIAFTLRIISGLGAIAVQATTVNLNLIGRVEGGGAALGNAVTVANGFTGVIDLRTQYQVSPDVTNFLAAYYSLDSDQPTAFSFQPFAADSQTVHFAGPFTGADLLGATLPTAAANVNRSTNSITLVADGSPYDSSQFPATGSESFRLQPVAALAPGNYTFTLAASANDGLGWNYLSNPDFETLPFTGTGTFTLTVIPEPTAVGLLALGLNAVLRRRHRRVGAAT